jgi:hypothetical protein
MTTHNPHPRETGERLAQACLEDAAGDYTLAAAQAAIRKLRADLRRAERERDTWKAKADGLAAELERRDRNENRNCLNWGPCSRHDGHMEDVS